MTRSIRRGARAAVVVSALIGLLGAAAPAVAAARPLFQLPFACGASITMKTYAGHDDYDIDMYLYAGAPVFASAAGTVTFSGWDSGGGNSLRVNHGGGWETLYLHMAQAPMVPVGGHVNRGQQVGLLGKTGASGNTYHLHYEQLINGSKTESYFNGVPSGITIDDRQNTVVMTSKNCDTPPAEPTPPAAAVVFGDAEGSPAIGRHAGDRLELFPVSRTGGVGNVYESVPNGHWSDLFGFGPDLPVRQALPVNHGDGRMEVFAVGADGSVWNRFEAVGNGPWSGWSNFAPAGSATSVFAARHYNSNRLEIFAVKPDGSIWNKFETRMNGPWSGWNVFAATPGRAFTSATIGVHADNRLEVFAVAADGSIWNKYETAPDGAWSDWDPFAPAGTAAYLKAGRHGSGRLEVFAVKADGSISNKYELRPNAPWSGWNGFAGAGTVSTDPQALNIATHHGGRIEVFAVTPNGAVLNRFESMVDGPWSGWNGFADPGHAVRVNATRHKDNRLEVFTTAADGSISNKYESAPNAAWSVWNPWLAAQ